MKKTIICLNVLLMCLLSTKVAYADEPSLVEEDDVTIYYDESSDTVYLNNYDDSTSIDVEGFYTIESETDLTINLTGDNYISCSDGIYAWGNLTIKGEGTLTINYLQVDGSIFSVEGGTVILASGSSSYLGPYVSYPAYIVYEDNGNTYSSKYDVNNDTYASYNRSSFVDTEITISSIVPPVENIKDSILSTTATIYRNDKGGDIESLSIEKGVIKEINGADTTVSISKDNNNVPIYNISFKGTVNDDGYLPCTIEFGFDKSAWGKLVYFDIIEAKNVYELSGPNVYTPLVTMNNYSQNHYIGSDSYYATVSGQIDDIPSIYLQYQAKSNNSIKLKMRGDNNINTDNYVWINLTIEDSNSKDDKEAINPVIEEEKERFVIPNTGVFK